MTIESILRSSGYIETIMSEIFWKLIVVLEYIVVSIQIVGVIDLEYIVENCLSFLVMEGGERDFFLFLVIYMKFTCTF